MLNGIKAVILIFYKFINKTGGTLIRTLFNFLTVIQILYKALVIKTKLINLVSVILSVING